MAPQQPLYGQVVAGPPGSGKTTYCNGMQEYLRLLGRNAWVINLDPANEVPKKPIHEEKDEDGKQEEEKSLPYDTLLDVCECVISLSSVMKQLGLGPNGGLVYCMEYMEAHVDEILQMIQDVIPPGAYLIFDLPGQVELYTHGTAVPKLLHALVKVLDLRLVAVQLLDAHYCTEPSNFVSAALLGTTTMLRLELPTVSVLSKVDLLANYGPLPMSLEYFTDCQELDRLLPFLQGNMTPEGGDDYDYFDDDDDENDVNNYDRITAPDEDYADDPDYQKARRRTRSSPFFRKHAKLHQVLAEVVDEFGLLSFLPLDISSAESVGRVLTRIDKANGYVFIMDQASNNKTQDLFNVATRSDPSHYEMIADIQERLSTSRTATRQQPPSQKREAGGGPGVLKPAR